MTNLMTEIAEYISGVVECATSYFTFSGREAMIAVAVITCVIAFGALCYYLGACENESERDAYRMWNEENER